MSEQEAELQRIYTVPLSRAWITARHRRTRRAVNILREFAEHHMKSSEIKIDTDLNEELWKRGITKPPRRITVKMEKDEDGVVTISLPKETKRKQEEAVPTAPMKEEEAIVPEQKTAAPAETKTAPTPKVQETTKEAPRPKKATKKSAPKKKAKKNSE
jgi:large subunit ribosomal protein L31e